MITDAIRTRLFIQVRCHVALHCLALFCLVFLLGLVYEFYLLYQLRGRAIALIVELNDSRIMNVVLEADADTVKTQRYFYYLPLPDSSYCETRKISCIMFTNGVKDKTKRINIL